MYGLNLFRTTPRTPLRPSGFYSLHKVPPRRLIQFSCPPARHNVTGVSNHYIIGKPCIQHWKGVEFVVPDALVGISFSSLSKAGFHSCTESSECPYANPLQSPPPSTHLHIGRETAVSLYRKSDVLWAFLNFEVAPQPNISDIMSASDIRLPTAILGRGRGRFSPCHSLVRIPSAPRYCEALIYLLCRDYDTAYETYWMAILTYMLEFVDGADLLYEDGLGEAYRRFYLALKHGDSRVYLYTYFWTNSAVT